MEISSLCWNCKTEVGFKHFCDQCVKIQPLQPEEDFFTFLGLPQCLSLDPDSLKKRYYELSRKFHPDFYQKSSSEERLIATEKSSLLNKAYETLRDPFKRAEYLLDLQGIDAKKDLGPVSSDLLAEVFEIQESLNSFLEKQGKDKAGDVVLSGALNKELKKLHVRQDELMARLEAIFKEWDGMDARQAGALKKPLAEKLLRLLHEKKYIDSILRNIQSGLKKA